MPPEPKFGSRLPDASWRVSAKSVPVAVPRRPAVTILPSGWMTSCLAVSVADGGGDAAVDAERVIQARRGGGGVGVGVGGGVLAGGAGGGGAAGGASSSRIVTAALRAAPSVAQRASSSATVNASSGSPWPSSRSGISTSPRRVVAVGEAHGRLGPAEVRAGVRGPAAGAQRDARGCRASHRCG
jgi:hypothetical protein